MIFSNNKTFKCLNPIPLPKGFRQDLPYRRILKRFPVNDIAASYDDVITKNGASSCTVKSLLNSKVNEILIKSHLSKVFT